MPSEGSPEAVLAADVGGTRVRVALAVAPGRLVARDERPTERERGPDHLVAVLAALIDETSARATSDLGLDPARMPIVVATTGPIDADGAYADPTNLGQAWFRFPLGRRLEERIGRPVRVVQDTHASILGEWIAGALRGVRDAWYITVSTGVGGAQLVAGRLVLGADGVAGEVGHVPVFAGGPRCTCGARGHLEGVISGPAIARAGAEAARAGRSPALAAIGRRPSAEDVSAAAAAGDRGAANVLASARRALGRGVAGLVNATNPERVILGGGVVMADPGPWVAACRDELDRGGVEVALQHVEIRAAELGQDNGLIGCLALAVAQP